MSSRVAILVGNSTFGEGSGISDLGFPDRDVTVLAGLCRDVRIGRFDKVVTLINRSSTEIIGTVEDTIAQNAGAFFLFYYSGHGKVSDNGKLYLAACNTTNDRLHSTGVSVSNIIELKDSYGCSRFGLLLDCCYSGLAASEVKGSDQDQVSALVGGTGIFFLGACASTQIAKEDSVLKHGVLSSGIIDGLKTGLADIDGDGRISGPDLFKYCCDYVARHSGQRPTCVNRVSGADLVLAYAPVRQLSQADITRVVQEKLVLCRTHRLLPQRELLQLEAFFNSTTASSPIENSFEHGFMRFAIGEILLADLQWYRDHQKVTGVRDEDRVLEKPPHTNSIRSIDSLGEVLSFDGRIARAKYWKVNVILLLICSLLFVLLSMTMGSFLGRSNSSHFALVYTITTLPFYWASFAAIAKRLHDVGHGWAWVLPIIAMNITMVVIQIWGQGSMIGLLQFVAALPTLALGFVPGMVGANKYGPDPLGP